MTSDLETLLQKFLLTCGMFVGHHNLTFESRDFRFSAPTVWNSLYLSVSVNLGDLLLSDVI